MKRGLNNRGLSPVIAVVLLLLITIVAAGIIIAFVIPFVENTLDDSGECFDVLGDLSFAQTEFNCFNSTQETTGISVRNDNENIVGFRLSLQSGGSADSFDILQGESYEGLKMLEGVFDENLEAPAEGGVRTYVASGQFDRAEIFPLLGSGRACNLADEINFVACEDPEASALIGS